MPVAKRAAEDAHRVQPGEHEHVERSAALQDERVDESEREVAGEEEPETRAAGREREPRPRGAAPGRAARRPGAGARPRRTAAAACAGDGGPPPRPSGRSATYTAEATSPNERNAAPIARSAWASPSRCARDDRQDHEQVLRPLVEPQSAQGGRRGAGAPRPSPAPSWSRAAPRSHPRVLPPRQHQHDPGDLLEHVLEPPRDVELLEHVLRDSGSETTAAATRSTIDDGSVICETASASCGAPDSAGRRVDSSMTSWRSPSSCGARARGPPAGQTSSRISALHSRNRWSGGSSSTSRTRASPRTRMS